MGFVLSVAAPSSAQTPSRAGFVNDFAHVIDGGSVLELERIGRSIASLSEGEMVIVTLSTTSGEEPDAVVTRLIDAWRLWQEEPGARPSLLFLLVVDSGQVRVRSSPTVAGILEATVRDFLSTQLRNSFADRRYGPGVVAFARRVENIYRQAFGR